MTGVSETQQLWDGAASPNCSALRDSVATYLDGAETRFSRADAADLLAELHELERLRRRLAAVDHLMLAQIGQRNLAAELGFGTMPRFLQAALRLSPSEAAARVRAADVVGTRITLSGEAIEPILPTTALAAAAGDISPEHVSVLHRVLNEVPPTVGVEEFGAAERMLTEAARNLPPKGVADVGRRLLAYLQPDGKAPDENEQRRHRRLSVVERPDGSVEGSFRLAATAGAKLIAVLNSQAAPRPAADGVHDPRSYAQRMADALEDLCDLGLRTGRVVPGGPAVQLIVTMTADEFLTRKGLAATSHGQLLGIDSALELAAEADVMRVITDSRGVVLDLGRLRRCATRSQTLALHARDGGCSFPGCTKPTDWCERHHVIAWVDGGRTDLQNLTLLCSLHHREFRRWGWECVMDEGLPTWIPPASIDPDRRPRRNVSNEYRSSVPP